MTAANTRIREVWAHNLAEEMEKIAELVVDFDHVALDTEFPGVVARPLALPRMTDFYYQTLRCNVDLLKIIQLGITLSNARGEQPPGITTWQFNFRFNLAEDMYAQDSIDLLTNHGLDFAAHDRAGIDVFAFGELLISSGLVLDDAITWITFHGGYDFCYLLKVLTCQPLPALERDFFELLALYFPRFYDLKVLTRTSDRLHGGLNKIAETLGCERVGTAHQAGSDSLLTLHIFFCMVKDVFDGRADKDKLGQLYGLGSGAVFHLVPTDTPTPAISNGDGAPVAALTAS